MVFTRQHLGSVSRVLAPSGIPSDVAHPVFDGRALRMAPGASEQETSIAASALGSYACGSMPSSSRQYKVAALVLLVALVLLALASTAEVSYGLVPVTDYNCSNDNREHALRMQRALGNRDPADALLAARELLESVCKLVAEDYAAEVPKNASLGQLYGVIADALDLKAGAVEGDSDASKAARKVLQGLASIADGMGELRTRIGRGHGRTEVSPARQRHAELGTSAAATLALFILDTWHERRSRSI